eukprot:6209631-Prymnesium_polylepis.1
MGGVSPDRIIAICFDIWAVRAHKGVYHDALFAKGNTLAHTLALAARQRRLGPLSADAGASCTV